MKKTKVILITSFIILLSGSFVLWKMIQRSTPPPTPRTTVTIPEGWVVDDINELLKNEGVLVDGKLPSDLEGYLFPDTYEFFLDSSVEVVQNRFEENFQAKVGSLNLSLNEEELKDIITMASLIEKEIIDPKEMRIASGVLWKRMGAGIALQVDATICYIKAQQGEDSCIPITKSDKQIDSLYNTYLYRGLPPGPIGSPGIDAIKAAADPAQSPYWYYISEQETGRTIFARTLDEHNDNIVKYLGE